MRILFSLFVLIVVSLSACDSAPKSEQEEEESWLTKQIDEYISAHLANNHFNGSLLICKDDSVLFQKSYGYTDRDKQLPNTDSSVYLIGSITKPFTSLAIMLLEQEGKLSLDDKLSNYFPDFPRAEEVTIEMLLTHTSGIQDYHVLPDWREYSQRDITPEYTISRVAELPYRFEPGTSFRYSNSGYILLGLIIEQVTAKTYAEYIHWLATEKLELEHTGVIENGMKVEHLALGYSSTPRETKPADYMNYLQPFSSGNMYSTPMDLWHFTQALMNEKLLINEQLAEMLHERHGGYGYGWGIRNFEGVKAYGHYGAMNGYVGALTYIPEGEYFICFLTNNDNTYEYTVTADLVAILQGQAVDVPEKMKLKKLSPAMVESVVGDYMVKEGDTLHVFVDEGLLYMQETAQDRHELFPLGDNKYAMTLFEFPVAFSDTLDGKTQLLEFLPPANLSAPRVQ